MQNYTYETTHPWLKFQYGPQVSLLWAKLGEAFSKCQHLAGIPLQPGLAQELGSLVMNKGVLATAAIEGNTLSEHEVQQILEEGRSLPPSQDYLEQEIRNVAEAISAIDHNARTGNLFQLTPQWLKEQNAQILKDLETRDDVVAGEYTSSQLVVGSVYRAAPPAEVPYLVDRMCAWLNESFIKPSQDPNLPDDFRFFNAFFGAVLGHLYTVWIHPFGDGNGRTARLLEVAILGHCGVVPWVSSNLLSDHYNRTRSRYYARLDDASKKNDIDGFIQYAAEGLVDMLREHIDRVREHQVDIAWQSFVHERFAAETPGKTKDRRTLLVLALSGKGAVAKAAMRHLTPELAEAYAGLEDRAIARDLKALEKLGLVHETSRRNYWAANQGIMRAFMPLPVRGS